MRMGPTLGALALGLMTWSALGACSGSELRGPLTTADGAVEDATDTVDPGDSVVDDTADVEDADTAPPVDVADATDAADTVTPPLAWITRSLGDEGVLSDVFAVGPREAYAVGGARALRYNGSGWAAWGEPSADVALYGVWAGDGVVVVVGDGGLAAVRHPEDAHWALQATGVTVALRGVYGRAADDVWAVGDDATIVHWDGAAWTPAFTVAGITLRSAWIAPETTGADGVYAVGTGGQLAEYREGAWRLTQIAKADAELRDIFGVDGALFAVGTEATITVKKVTAPNWQGQTSNDPRDSDLFAIVGRAADDVVAFGADGTVIRYNGQKWTVEAATGPRYAAADLVSATWVDDAGSDRYLVVGADGGGLALSGTSWVDMPTRPARGVRDFAGAPEAHVCAVGSGGLMMTWGDQGWTAVPLATTADLNGVAVAEDGTSWAVGSAGTIVRTAPDGTVTFPESGVPLDLFGVAVASDRVWMCGKGGTLLSASLDGETVTLAPSGVAFDLKAAVVDAADALWLVGASGTLLRRLPGDGSPVAIASGVGGSLNDVVLTGAGVLAVGDNGVVVDATASGAVLRNEAPGLFLFGAAAEGDVEFAVGWNGTILRRVGDAFVAEVSGTVGVLQAVWTDGTRAIVGGSEGVLLERVEAP